MTASYKYTGAKMASFSQNQSTCWVAANIKRGRTEIILSLNKLSRPHHADGGQKRKIPYAWQPGWRAPITV